MSLELRVSVEGTLDDLPDGNNRVAMTPEQQSQLAVLWTDASQPPAPISLENTVDSYTANRLAMTPVERQKLASIAPNASPAPTDLDGVPDSGTRLAMTAPERLQLGVLWSERSGAPEEPAPTSLDDVPDGYERFAVSADQKGRTEAAYFGGTPPTMFRRWRNVYRLDRDFGAHNLQFDSTDKGGGTDDRANWMAIRDALAAARPDQFVELTGPKGRFSRISSALCWTRDKTLFADDWGLVCDSPNGDQRVGSSVLVLNSVTSANYVGAQAGERLFSTQDVPAGTQQLSLPKLSDAAAIGPNGKRILILNAYCGYDTADGLVHPGKMWFTDARQLGSSALIQLSEPLPFDITIERNPAAFSGGFPWQDANGMPLFGSAFRICGPGGDGGVATWVANWVPGGKEFCVRDVEFHGVRLVSTNGHLFFGMAQNAVFSGCQLWARRGIWYLNTALGGLFEDNHCQFGSHAWETSMSSALNTWRRNRYSHHGKPGVVPNWLAACKEYSHTNLWQDETLWAPNYTANTSAPFRVLLYDGADNKVTGCNMLVGVDSPTIRMVENDVAWGSPEYSGSRNTFLGCRIGTNKIKTASGPSIVVEGNQNQLHGVSCLYGAGSSPSNLVVDSRGNVIENVEDVGMTGLRKVILTSNSSANRLDRNTLQVTNNAPAGANDVGVNDVGVAVPQPFQRPFWA